MSRLRPYSFPAVLILATAGSLLPWSEYRWLAAMVTAGLIGASIVLIRTRANVSARTWTVVSCLCVAGGLGVFAALQWQMPECTAVNLSGERVVIGRQLTDAGAAYFKSNPGNDNNLALADLADGPPTLMWTPASIQSCRLTLAALGALWMPLLGIAALTGIKALDAAAVPAAAAPKQQIFLSYNHADSEAARRLCRYLTDHGLQVAIDTESMQPGERISGFIERSIRESDVVVSLVSNRSLLSAWVAMETIQTLSRNKWVNSRLFIACYLDDDFFKPEFRLESTKKIDERLKEIEQLIPEYAERKIDTIDLNDEKTRLYDLRNGLGTILAALKDSLCLDVRGESLEESGRRLVAAVRDLRGSNPRVVR